MLLAKEPTLIEARDGLGETALHYLAVENHIAAVKVLVASGARVDGPLITGRSRAAWPFVQMYCEPARGTHYPREPGRSHRKHRPTYAGVRSGGVAAGVR
jgi:hypothetical protein